jgi:hypothetical protein
MYEIGLNPAKRNNFMFFDFEAPLCLSITQNTGVVERLTPRILIGLKTGVLIQLNGPKVEDENKSDTDFKSEIIQEVSEDTSEDKEEVEQDSKPKRIRKAKSKK